MEKNTGKPFAIAGFVLALVGAVISFFTGWFSIVALPVSIVGLVLSVIGRKKSIAAGFPGGLGTAGLVIGIIATVISTINFFTCGICVLCLADEVNDLVNGL